MPQFDHERLEVYRLSLAFAGLADEIAADLASKRTTLGDQLRRAAFSITLNIAEGAGEFSRKEKARFYRMAARSGTECAAVLDICQTIKAIDGHRVLPGKELLLRIVSMLIRLGQNLGKREAGTGEEKESGTGTGRGTGTGPERKPR